MADQTPTKIANEAKFIASSALNRIENHEQDCARRMDEIRRMQDGNQTTLRSIGENIASFRETQTTSVGVLETHVVNLNKNIDDIKDAHKKVTMLIFGAMVTLLLAVIMGKI